MCIIMNSRGDNVQRVVLVTGASRGLGASIAKLFLENNDVVYINYNQSKIEAENLCKNYELAIPIKCDVSSEEEIKAMIEKIKEITTKKQERMAFVTASDETDTANFVVFASLMKELEGIRVGDVVHVMGRVSRRFSDYQINVNKIEKIG